MKKKKAKKEYKTNTNTKKIKTHKQHKHKGEGGGISLSWGCCGLITSRKLEVGVVRRWEWTKEECTVWTKCRLSVDKSVD